jgi:hypothetical protein
MDSSFFMRMRSLLLVIALILFATGCSMGSVEVAPAGGATPTVSPLFLAPTTIAMPAVAPTTPASFADRLNPSVTPVSVAEAAGFAQLPVYGDQLVDHWDLLGDSWGMAINPAQSRYVYDGTAAIAARPQRGSGRIQFSVQPGMPRPYLRSEVLGLSFWLSGGQSYIYPEDFVVTVMGSNSLTYWDANDNSVQVEGRVTDAEAPIFSQTRLYYLDINRAIPPNTWVEVVLWLDEREFDPIYRYVTGFYLSNDEQYQDTFYIDRVRLIVDSR